MHIKLITVLVITFIGLMLSVEWFARGWLGLGNPALTMFHPTIEYLFKPNQDVRRFDNRIKINAYGMRSEDFLIEKVQNELRIMVFGDSVLNGGSLTDQNELATELLRSMLQQQLERPVVMGNISAGSWGPGNWLAYAQEYGFFNADIVIFLISTHDLHDNPTYAQLNSSTHPQKKPISAAWEGATRYLPRYLPNLTTDTSQDHLSDKKTSVDYERQSISRGALDILSLLDLAKSKVKTVIVVQFLDRSELLSKPESGFYLIREIAELAGVTVTSTDLHFRDAFDATSSAFRDNIHITAEGQALLASTFFDIILTQLSEK